MHLLAVLISLVMAVFAAAETVVPVGEFRSVQLSNGGHVVIRHGAVQRVTIVSGDPQSTRIRIGRGQRLEIDSMGSCSRGLPLEVEVVTPHLAGAAVDNGGTLEVDGSFPDQPSLAASVEQGGTVDVRAIAADTVDASVEQGGTIFTTARKSLDASVESGGVITYWGDVSQVRKSVRDGGAVSRGGR